MIKKIAHTKILIVSIIAAILLLEACNKDGAGCFENAGNNTTVSVDVPVFKSIDVSTNVEIQLLSFGVDRVEISTGENLIEGISLQVVDSVLKIENLNSCFWTKGYERPLVSIRNSVLEGVIQHGYGNIYSIDTLRLINDFTIQVEDASGAVDLIVDANHIGVVSNNIGPITLQGITEKLVVSHAWNDGILYARDLKVQNFHVWHVGSNRMEVNVENSFTGVIGNIGNVYLYGQNPTKVDVEITGQGEIVKMF